MKTLIIYAHPPIEGHCSRVLANVKEFHERNKIDYQLIDLYKIKYNPILGEEEHYTTGGREVSAQNKQFQESIEQTDKIIIVFPVWWGSMPAILKGFFDRVLTARWAYAFKPNGQVEKLLKGKKALVFQTLGGPGYIYHMVMNPPKLVIKHIILGLCGIQTKVRQFFLCRRLDEKKEMEIKNKVEKDMLKFYG